ncbi:Hypothetical predicted protein [Olea europaea subsp. europaea]|uniref:Uncharacterized protein n=1 Tax=Olea europaea subsp. europaea TaxID=158383 RepID=A0A8S0QTJ6_OLEEU|nr:Hypothetical predicted protein [Olea europaea subsp. europaea]
MADSQVEPVAMTGVVNTDNSQIRPPSTHSEQLKEEEKKGEEAKEEKKREEEKKNGQQNLNSSLIITGVVVAVIGAIFAIFKNIKKA